ncbi:MAG TPA: tryptophan halogenase family protein [Sphingomicrobium sp.]|jgi:tryptophan halogenase|nr:tryptophan halogenase family protein [Sphingomicrobium sp.]
MGRASGPLRKIIVVGGGTAGWMAAAAISKLYQNPALEIHVIESSEIGIVGVGEATIPPILTMNGLLGIDEDEFVRKTRATFKLAIQYVDWMGPETKYLHPFGMYGFGGFPLALFHYWRRFRAERGEEAGTLWDYSLTSQAALAGKFQRRVPFANMQGNLAYAFHFDASLYARFLRGLAESNGVRRHDRKITGHKLDDEGFVEAVILEDGEAMEADLFIDCSGFRGLLIEGALGTGYEDWTHWLPCDRAVAMPSEFMPDIPPYTRSTARRGGWQWRIPLQHRTGNGIVYCSSAMSDDEAGSILSENLPAPATAEPRFLKFVTGKRKLFWNKNVVALGLASGFLEPLESTSIHLIQSGVEKLLKLFPDRSFREVDIDLYNRLTALEYEQARDLIVFHYFRNGRDDSEFWRSCRAMTPPDTLMARIDLFMGYGRIHRREDELFGDVSWASVFEGQDVQPSGPHPLTLGTPIDRIEDVLTRTREMIARGLAAMPSHPEFLVRACGAQLGPDTPVQAPALSIS